MQVFLIPASFTPPSAVEAQSPVPPDVACENAGTNARQRTAVGIGGADAGPGAGHGHQARIAKFRQRPCGPDSGGDCRRGWRTGSRPRAQGSDREPRTTPYATDSGENWRRGCRLRLATGTRLGSRNPDKDPKERRVVGIDGADAGVGADPGQKAQIGKSRQDLMQLSAVDPVGLRLGVVSRRAFGAAYLHPDCCATRPWSAVRGPSPRAARACSANPRGATTRMGRPLSPALPHKGGREKIYCISWQACVSQARVSASSDGPTSARTRAW
jgi:hypothetical protein